MTQQAITITFGECAENHVGMQKIGEKGTRGYTPTEMREMHQQFQNMGVESRLIHLGEDADVLIVPGGVECLLNKGVTSKDLYKELIALEWDTKAKMRGRVVNKRARYNLCFDQEESSPNYEEGKGTVVSYDRVPILSQIRNNLPKFFGNELASNLKAEGNLYYDTNKCGIGFHGDSERKVVIALRLGEPIPLHYQWYQKGERVGDRIELEIGDGDIYVMSEQATGNNWKKRNIKTLRHAAGCAKYLK